jgi:hypothetical protein
VETFIAKWRTHAHNNVISGAQTDYNFVNWLIECDFIELNRGIILLILFIYSEHLKEYVEIQKQ